jgi:hypothetical protein
LVGFFENPREQVLGYHAIFDHHKTVIGDIPQSGDENAWHYHHPRPDGSFFASRSFPYEGWNSHFDDDSVAIGILAHNLVDRGWFPTAFRAGGMIEDEQLSKFLEKYIPIDFSSRGDPVVYPDGSTIPGYAVSDEKLFDWRGSPNDWSWYHPSVGDYRKPGDMKRVIFMSLDHGNLHSLELLTKERIDAAFDQARRNRDVVLSYNSHDFIPNVVDIFDNAYSMICDASKRYGIKWCYALASDAARKVCRGGKGGNGPTIKLAEHNGLALHVDKPLFGSPFVVHVNGSCCYDVLTAFAEGNTYLIKPRGAGGKIFVSATNA